MTQSKIGEYHIREASKMVKIKSIPDSEEKVKEALKLGMRLMGVKTLPNEEEKRTLVNHITRQYCEMSIDELKNAFTLAVSGELSYQLSTPQFSPLIISNILNSYKQHRAKILSKVKHEFQNKTITTQEKQKIELEFIDECIVKAYIQYIELGKNKADLYITHSCPTYDLLKEKGILSPSKDQEKEMSDKAAKLLSEKRGKHQSMFQKILSEYDKDKHGSAAANVKMKEMFVSKWYENKAKNKVTVEQIETLLKS